MFQSSSERFSIEDGDRRLVLRVIDRALGLVAQHHGDRLAAERAAQPVELAGQMGHVATGVGEHQTPDRVRVPERIFDAEPTAP
jgi:hypothetical protein